MCIAPFSRTTKAALKLPSYLYKSGAQNPCGAANLRGKSIHGFLEGPSLNAFYNLCESDIPFGRVFRITPVSGRDLTVKHDGGLNGGTA
jgi:gluconolactonase